MAAMDEPYKVCEVKDCPGYGTPHPPIDDDPPEIVKQWRPIMYEYLERIAVMAAPSLGKYATVAMMRECIDRLEHQE